MKYCEKCKKEFNMNENVCPVCGNKMIDVKVAEDNENEYEAVEIVSTMMLTGIL